MDPKQWGIFCRSAALILKSGCPNSANALLFLRSGANGVFPMLRTIRAATKLPSTSYIVALIEAGERTAGIELALLAAAELEVLATTRPTAPVSVSAAATKTAAGVPGPPAPAVPGGADPSSTALVLWDQERIEIQNPRGDKIRSLPLDDLTLGHQRLLLEALAHDGRIDGGSGHKERDRIRKAVGRMNEWLKVRFQLSADPFKVAGADFRFAVWGCGTALRTPPPWTSEDNADRCPTLSTGVPRKLRAAKILKTPGF